MVGVASHTAALLAARELGRGQLRHLLLRAHLVGGVQVEVLVELVGGRSHQLVLSADWLSLEGQGVAVEVDLWLSRA